MVRWAVLFLTPLLGGFLLLGLVYSVGVTHVELSLDRQQLHLWLPVPNLLLALGSHWWGPRLEDVPVRGEVAAIWQELAWIPEADLLQVATSSEFLLLRKRGRELQFELKVPGFRLRVQCPLWLAEHFTNGALRGNDP